MKNMSAESLNYNNRFQVLNISRLPQKVLTQFRHMTVMTQSHCVLINIFHPFCTSPLHLFQVMLRVKESEVQYLKQEINSLKDELHAAQRVCFLCQGETEITPTRFNWDAKYHGFRTRNMQQISTRTSTRS